MEKTLTVKYTEYDSMDALGDADRMLMQRAIESTGSAYAPYSGFHVGAALRLADGSIVAGSNQENGAYPSGLCAERTALFAASAQRPDLRDYEALAIAGCNSDGHLCEASPCGACRQVMAEYEQLQGHPMRILCLLDDGRVREVASVADLLPFSFHLEQ